MLVSSLLFKFLVHSQPTPRAGFRWLQPAPHFPLQVLFLLNFVLFLSYDHIHWSSGPWHLCIQVETNPPSFLKFSLLFFIEDVACLNLGFWIIGFPYNHSNTQISSYILKRKQFFNLKKNPYHKFYCCCNRLSFGALEFKQGFL